MFDFTDVTVVIAVIVGLSELVKRIGVNPKFIPIVNIIIGILAGIVYTNPGDFKAGIFTGIVMGLSASGLYSGTKNMVQAIQAPENNK